MVAHIWLHCSHLHNFKYIQSFVIVLKDHVFTMNVTLAGTEFSM